MGGHGLSFNFLYLLICSGFFCNFLISSVVFLICCYSARCSFLHVVPSFWGIFSDMFRYVALFSVVCPLFSGNLSFPIFSTFRL